MSTLADGWTLRLADTLTGRMGAFLPATTSGSGEDQVNGPSSLSVTVPTPWLLRQPRDRFGAWSGSIAACWDDEPVLWGPILDDGEGDDRFYTLPVGGLWSLWDHRIVTDHDYSDAGFSRATISATVHGWLAGGASDEVIWKAIDDLASTGVYRRELWTQGWPGTGIAESDPAVQLLKNWHKGKDASLSDSVVSLKNMSLGTIGRRIVELAQQRPNGWVPLSYASPVEATGHERNYEGFNVANNGVSKRLKELSEVINGPDFHFRPRWRERGVSLEWVMHHGTEAMPELAQDHPHILDLTAPQGQAATRKVTAKSERTHRVYATGAGQDKAMLIRIEQKIPPDGMPFLESALSDGQTENADLLSARARGVLQQGRQVQISASVSLHDYPPHIWWPGEAFDVHWPDGWLQLEGGVYRSRVLKRTFNLNSHMCDIEFQPEVRI